MRRLREVGDPVDVVIITPEPGRQAEIGQRLLALAEHPSQVRWVTWPRAGYSVPVELFGKFEADSDNAEEPVEQEPPKKRGRPRKAQQPVERTDDPEKEE